MLGYGYRLTQLMRLCGDDFGFVGAALAAFFAAKAAPTKM